MFVGADAFFQVLLIIRLCWIRGRLGGGKTLLGVAILHELQQRGLIKGSITNIPTTLPLIPWREEIEPGVFNLILDAGVMLDEAWTILDNRTSLTNDRSYGAFARKLRTIWLFPSVIPIDKRVAYLSVEREKRISIPFVKEFLHFVRTFLHKIPGGRFLWPLLGPLGRFASEVWVYRWTLDMGYMQDTGTFKLIYPERYFGMYDTGYIPFSDAGIGKLWSRTVEQALANDADEGAWDYDGEQQQTDNITEWAGSLQQPTGGPTYTNTTNGASKVRDIASRLQGQNGRYGQE